MTEPLSATPLEGAQRDWAGILDQGENILWQGRPLPRLRLEFQTPFEPLFFTFFTGFSVFWMVGASRAGGLFWTFGLLFFVVGSYSLIGQHYWKRYLRAHTFYTLTDRRALIATDVWGRRTLKSYPIAKSTMVELADGAPGSVFFATETQTDSDGDRTHSRIGFELVEDCRSVYALIRQIQSTR